MPETSTLGRAPRHAILDLAPLELDCMTAIWSLGAGTVRDVQAKLMATRPRAYTTVMTIMDRLAQKGIVSRQKVGRAYRYQANLSPDEARNSAVQKVVAGFFNGSAEALASHIASSKLFSGRVSSTKYESQNEISSASVEHLQNNARQPLIHTADEPVQRPKVEPQEIPVAETVPERLDESLL